MVIPSDGHTRVPAGVPAGPPSGIRLMAWSALDDAARGLANPDPVFFEASNTQTFASPGDRAAFRDFWLGQYLREYPDFAFVALAPTGACVGYTVAWPDDPNAGDRFLALDYLETARDLIAAHPAHLHVNVAATKRGLGIGAQLIASVCDALRLHAVPGVHVVTEVDARNLGFYGRNGFCPRASLVWGDRRLSFLARDLVAHVQGTAVDTTG